jgi:hypothetical protein
VLRGRRRGRSCRVGARERACLAQGGRGADGHSWTWSGRCISLCSRRLCRRWKIRSRSRCAGRRGERSGKRRGRDRRGRELWCRRDRSGRLRLWGVSRWRVKARLMLCDAGVTRAQAIVGVVGWSTVSDLEDYLGTASHVSCF